MRSSGNELSTGGSILGRVKGQKKAANKYLPLKWHMNRSNTSPPTLNYVYYIKCATYATYGNA